MKEKSLILKTCIGILCSIVLSINGFSQPFVPVNIGGFNHDVVAESGNSSLTNTTVSLDGFTISNKVIYTTSFRTTNGFGGGGIPDNGLITDASGSYQLADYAGNNALIIQRNGTGDILINTPAQFKSIRLLCFSTEGTSLINANLFFTDGTSTTALTNYTLGDWFNTTTNLVLSGFGRCTRATPATGADAYPNNPRMFYIDIPLACADRQKSLERISLANVTTAGTNAPYPNAVFFAVSATSYDLQVAQSITDATCTTGGSATLSVTGTASPYNVSWNTTPVQTGLTATGLSQGTYIATVTDANNCTSTQNVTVALTDNLTLIAHIDTAICYGASFDANTISNATGYSWLPAAGVSNPAIANPVLSPTVPSTLYTVTATLGSCTSTQSFTVTVAAEITLTVPAPQTICSQGSFAANTVSNATTFQWTPATGVSNTSVASPVFNPASTTTYSVIASTGVCSVNGSFEIAVAPQPNVNAGSNVTIAAGQSIQLQASADPGTYLWTPSAGLSAVNILNPVASPSVTTTYTLTITNTLNCTNSDEVEVQVVPECAKPMNAITPNGDGINDKWLVTFGNCLSVAKVKVFNRYGSPVFESDNYQNNWEGTYKGKSIPDGTYYYVIEYRQNNGNTIMLKGDLTILR